jgi:hypothetical protein
LYAQTDTKKLGKIISAAAAKKLSTLNGEDQINSTKVTLDADQVRSAMVEERLRIMNLKQEIFRPERAEANGYSSLMQNDPLLQTHTENELTTRRRGERRQGEIEIEKIRTRYDMIWG